jgi:hypothetical protein
LMRRDAAVIVVYRSRALDKPHVELRLPGAAPSITAAETRVSFKSANGGRTVEWRIREEDSTLDLMVSHGLEVNVEADLDPAVDHMNTDGTISVDCVRPSLAARATADGEWHTSIGIAKSVNLFQSTGGRSYAVQTIGWGRDLTPEWGPRLVRGQFAWAIEAMPVFAQFSPSSIYGLGFAPVVWRWNFVPRTEWSWFAELSMGGMWSTQPIPEGTSRGNFTAHWGAGVRLRARGPHAWLLAYRFQHFSNGNQLGSNPGVNAHVVLAGWSYRRYRS